MNYNPIGKNQCNINNNGETNSSVSPSASPTYRIETFYDMREVLGDGTSGQVRRAIHRKSGKERAVKVISLRRHVDISTIESEVSLLQSLDHPYIVKLIEVFVHNGVAMYLVMELVKGGDLFDCIVEKQRYSEMEARRAMRRLLSAIHYLHEESNIVHRDLKPENVLCSSPTDVKLADFGLAKILKADGLKTFCGTPAYFAPEVLQRRGTVAGQGRYGKPADIWSLGVILYILLTGKPPFDADIDEPRAFNVDFDSDHHIWSQMATAKELVEQMLHQDPKQRLTVCEACDHSWINVDDGDTHCNPLDDPATDARKRLINNDSNEGNTMSPYSNCNGILPQKEVAVVISNNNKNQNTFHLDSSAKASNPTSISKPDSPNVASSYRNIKSTPVESNSINRDNKTNDTERVVDDDIEIKSDSTHDSYEANTEYVESVQHSDKDCEPPRSPLTKLNLNQRCNKFREQIINQSDISTPLEVSKSGNYLSNDDGESKTAVTPVVSNGGNQQQQIDTQMKGSDLNDEDSILSQFSSKSSDIGSFTDSSVSSVRKRDTSEEEETHSINHERSELNCTKKRSAEDGSAKSTSGSPKRSKINNSKQTTLNAWLVKKGES